MDQPDDQHSDTKMRTPTDTLMLCLEDFGRAEPDIVIVLYTNQEGEYCYSTSAYDRLSHLVGLLECCKAMMLKRSLLSE